MGIDPISGHNNINVDPSQFIMDSHGGNSGGSGYIVKKPEEVKIDSFDFSNSQEDDLENDENLTIDFKGLIKSFFANLKKFLIHLIVKLIWLFNLTVKKSISLYRAILSYQIIAKKYFNNSSKKV